MWQIIRHANQAEAAVESLIMLRVPPQRHLSTSHRPPLSPSRLRQPPRLTYTPILLLPLYPQTDRWTRDRGWSSGRRGECGEDWVVWLVVAPGVELLYVDLGGGVLLFIFGFHWSVSLNIIVVLFQLSVKKKYSTFFLWQSHSSCSFYPHSSLCFAVLTVEYMYVWGHYKQHWDCVSKVREVSK